MLGHLDAVRRGSAILTRKVFFELSYLPKLSGKGLGLAINGPAVQRLTLQHNPKTRVLHSDLF
jgi:hypothetical protein